MKIYICGHVKEKTLLYQGLKCMIISIFLYFKRELGATVLYQ